MSSTLNHTIETAKNVMDSANEGAERAVGKAKHAVGSFREGAGHAVSSARTTFWDRVKTVTEIVLMLRGFQAEDALGWLGLARRRSPFLPIGIFGAGLVVGASAGVLFAPLSGADTRRLILARLAGLKQQAGVGKEAEEPARKAANDAIPGAKPEHIGPDAPNGHEPDKSPAPHNANGNGNRVA
jgi:hypothetical protein